jgi:polar amino acid transport system substrate-binding protein
MRARSKSSAGGLVVLALTALALCGCGSSDGGRDTSSAGTRTKTNAKVAAEVPDAVKAKGMLTVATDATYPPNEFVASDRHTVVGMDPDLARALAGTMGLKVKIVNATFDSILPGLASQKYDLGMAGFTDTKEREQAVDFVTYFSAGTSFLIGAQGGPAIAKLADLCGHRAAVEKGTTQQDDATAQAKRCSAAGKPTVSVLVFPDQNGANLALSSGRADVGMADSPVAAWLAKKSNGRFKVVGRTYGTAPYGVAIPKGTGMDRPILSAMKTVMANGQYRAILQKWGLASGAIGDPTLNGAQG